MSISETRRTIERTYFAEMVLAALALEGHTEIRVPLEQLEDEVFRDLIIKTWTDDNTRAFVVKLSFRSKWLQEMVDKKRQYSEVAEYTIEEPEPKLIPPSVD